MSILNNIPAIYVIVNSKKPAPQKPNKIISNRDNALFSDGSSSTKTLNPSREQDNGETSKKKEKRK